MRRAQSILSLAALLWGFAQAPSSHIHGEGELDHPGTPGLAHIHLGISHHEEGSHWEAYSPDQDAVELAWNLSSPPVHVIPLDAGVEVQSLVIAPVLMRMRLPADRFHSHDPPALELQNPRAPPA